MAQSTDRSMWRRKGALLQPATEDLIEWVLLLSLAVSGLCVLALAVMMFVGRWQHEAREREKSRRLGAPRTDARDVEAR